MMYKITIYDLALYKILLPVLKVPKRILKLPKNISEKIFKILIPINVI